ncbi:hypothetical protein CHH52_10015 [Shouchella clausii]|nr:hypothetical protein CHH52_10015 [Shouchella clausii]
MILPITSQPTKWVYAVPIPKIEGRDTYGAIYVDQIKSFDLSARKWKYIEPLNDEEIIKQVCERAESLVALL